MTWGPWHDLAFVSIDGLVAGFLYYVYWNQRRILKNVEEAPSVPVGSDLDSLFQRSGGGGPENTISYAVIRGRVKELGSQVLDSQATGIKGVLQVTTMNEHSVRRLAFGHWGDAVKQIVQTKQAVPFGLQEMVSSSYNKMVEVVNPFEATPESLLLPVSSQFNPVNSTVGSTLMGFFTGVASKGVETTEEMLPIGSIITALGQIVREPNGNYKIMPTMDDSRPYMLSSLPVEGVIKKLKFSRTVFGCLTVTFFTIGLYVGLRRMYEIFKEYRIAKLRQKILRKRNQTDNSKLSDVEMCIICLSNPRELIFLDCGHVCCCVDCVDKLENKCPVCREYFKSTHPAFIV